VKDANEPGCFNDAGTAYDPEDDDETHTLYQRLTGVVFDDSTLVSGHPDERSLYIRDSDFPGSVTVANGEVDMRFRNKRLKDVSKQGFRVKIESKKCSADEYPYSQESNKVADPDTADGWQNTRVHGLDRFGGRCYKVVLKKGKPFGDAKNIVLHFAPNEDQDGGVHFLSYYYEPDHPDLNDGSSSAKAAGLSQDQFAALDNGECVDISGGTACMNGVPDNF